LGGGRVYFDLPHSFGQFTLSLSIFWRQKLAIVILPIDVFDLACRVIIVVIVAVHVAISALLASFAGIELGRFLGRISEASEADCTPWFEWSKT